MVGLEPGRLVGDQSIRRRVALVEAVVGELGEQLEDLLGLLLRQTTLDGAGDEALALRVHLGLDLLAHRAAQHVGFAERIAGQDLGDLHHLLLVDDDAERLLQNLLDLRVDVVGLLLAELHRAIGRDVRHRAGAVQRHQRDDVLEAIGAHLHQRLAHAARFQLEHPDRLAAAEHLVCMLVVERDLFDVDGHAAQCEQLDRRGQRRQRLQAEKVELHQPGGLDPFHVELRRRHVRLRVAIQRHQLVERPVADDDAGGMRRGVGVQTFQRLRDFEKPRDLRLRRSGLLQPRLALDRLFQGHRLGGVLWHQLRQLVDLAERHLENASDIADHATRQKRTEGDDLRDLVGAVPVAHVADHLVAAVLAKVDVEVRHRDTFGVQEALEQQPELQRVEVGDGERVSDERTGARAASGPDRDSLVLGPFDEVGDDQEVAGEFHAGDDVEFEGEARDVDLALDARREAAAREAHLEPDLGLTLQLGCFVGRGARGEGWQNRLARARPVGTALRDLDRRGGRLGQVGEKREHLRAGLEAMLRRELATPRLADDGALRDADQRVMRVVVGQRREIRLVGRHQRQAALIGEVDQRGFRLAL